MKQQKTITRRKFLTSMAATSVASLVAGSTLTGCAHYFSQPSLTRRNFGERTYEEFQEMEDKGSVTKTYDESINNLSILNLKGEPYEMGFQHGRLLRDEVRANIGHVIRLAKFVVDEEMMDEAYDRMAPFIPLEHIEEMRGLAHGAEVSPRLIHWANIIPEVAEYRQNEPFVRFFKEAKWLKGSSCSNIVATGDATSDGKMYQLRVLDFVRLLNIQEYPVTMVHQPEEGNASMTQGYAGLIGSITGMNSQHMGFGEMGYGSPENETLEGIPFVFLFRKLMQHTSNLEEAVQMVRDAKRTCSYVYMIGDAKADEGVILETDRDRVNVGYAGQDLLGKIVRHNGEVKEKFFPGIEDVVYAGQFPDKINKSVEEHYGNINPQTLMEMANEIASKHNLHNLVMDLSKLKTWSTNARPSGVLDEFWHKKKTKWEGRAATQPWREFDFAEALNT